MTEARPSRFTNCMPATIQEKRIDAIESMMAIIHDLITKYSGPNILCDNGQEFSCNAHLLGSLLKASAIIGIWPRPEVPYLGFKIKTLADQVRGMQVFDNCEKSTKGRGFYDSPRSHGVKDSIEASIRSLKDRIPGLYLVSFLPETKYRSRKVKKKRAKKFNKAGKQEGQY